MLSALREEAAELATQLAAAQASVAAKDKLVQQLRGMVGAAGGLQGEGPWAAEACGVESCSSSLQP